VRFQLVPDVRGDLTLGMQTGAGDLVAVVQIAGVVPLLGRVRRVIRTVEILHDLRAAGGSKQGHHRHAADEPWAGVVHCAARFG